jgi:hypothetical protein
MRATPTCTHYRPKPKRSRVEFNVDRDDTDHPARDAREPNAPV